MQLSAEEHAKLVEIVKCYIRTWENEYSKAATERWTSVAEVSEQNINEAQELLEKLT